MDKWEYNVSVYRQDGGAWGSYQSFQQWLDEQGENGWELISKKDNAEEPTYIFKRKKL